MSLAPAARQTDAEDPQTEPGESGPANPAPGPSGGAFSQEQPPGPVAAGWVVETPRAARAGPGCRDPLAAAGRRGEGSGAGGGWFGAGLGSTRRPPRRPSTSAAPIELCRPRGAQPEGSDPWRKGTSPCFARGNAGAVGREHQGWAGRWVPALGAGEGVRKERER